MKGLKRMKIKTKIWVLFLACILMSSVISIGTVIYSSQKSNLKHIGEMTTQTLHAIDSNLELMIDHVNQDTYAVFWSKMFQDTLEEVSKGNLTVKTRTELQDCLTNIMLAGDYISSIVFYDNIGNSFMCNREEVVLKKDISVEKPTVNNLPHPSLIRTVIAVGRIMVHNVTNPQGMRILVNTYQ